MSPVEMCCLSLGIIEPYGTFVAQKDQNGKARLQCVFPELTLNTQAFFGGVYWREYSQDGSWHRNVQNFMGVLLVKSQVL